MNKIKVHFVWPLKFWSIHSCTRFNGGGYMYGASPYLASSIADGGSVLWLMEVLKRELLNDR